MPMTKNTMRAMIMNAGKTAPLAQHYTDTDISYIHPVVKYGKRYFDVFFAIIGLLLLLPILPLIVAAIKLDSKGPVIYRQTRMGRTRLYPEQTDWLHSAHSARRRTNTFKIIKFRSMYSDAENDGIARVAAQHDSRITPVGKFLRQTRLDETPQLINILRGEMSLIGPRPERPELAADIERKQPFFTERTYDVQPGLTGLAQINQSYLDSVDHIDTKLAYDHAYCLALSKPAVWLITDLRILVKTVFTVIKCNG